MKKLLFVLTGIVLVGAGCFQKPIEVPEQTADNQQNPPIEEPVYENPAVEDLMNDDTVPVYEGGALQALRSAQGNIYVTSPLPGAVVGNTLTMTGNARVFENVVNYRIKDTSGAVLQSGYTMADSPDIGQYGAYNISANISTVSAQPLTVEVYWQSAKDGSDADLVSFIVNKQ